MIGIVFNSSFFTEKDQLASGYQKYTARISLLKKIFALLAVLVVIILIILPFLDPSSTDEFRLTFEQINYEGQESEPVMISPNFQGIDNSGYPYNLTASQARNVQSDIIDLVEVRADIQTTPNEWVYFSSDTAQYNKIENKLDLHGNVNIFSSGGYELRSSVLSANIKKKSLRSDTLIEGQGPLGIIQADSFEAKNNGEYVKFSGNVKLTLFLSTKG